jgi:hypothetical protein
MQWDPASQSNQYTQDELNALHSSQQPHVAYVQRQLTPEELRSGNVGIAYILALPWLLGLAAAVAHGFQRHHVPELPYGIPLLIGILVACLGVLITTRFKLSWMALSLAAATYAAFNL